MNVKVLPLAIFIAAPTTSFAEETAYFGSFSYGMPTLNVKSELSIYGNSSSKSDDFTDNSKWFAGRFGAYHGNARYYGQLDYASAGHKDAKKDVTYTALTANADYVYRPNEMVGLFAGGHFGLGYADFFEAREKAGIAPGFQLGSFLHLQNGIELELGYRTTFTQIKTDDDGGKRPELSLNRVSGFYVSAGYTF